jgi:hypothetical protein
MVTGRARASEVEVGNGGAVLPPTGHRPHHQQLVQAHLAVEDVAFGQAVGVFVVGGGEEMGSGGAERQSYMPGVSVSSPTWRRMFWLSWPTSWPMMVARPGMGAMRQVSMRTVVVLPAPLGPRKPKTRFTEFYSSPARPASQPGSWLMCASSV